jgi:phospholipid/cholesterol/gamma-HCH transport system permease protein
MSPAQTALGTLQAIDTPSILQHRDSEGTRHVELRGSWILRSVRARTGELLRLLAQADSPDAHWDLTHVDDLDFAAASLLWRSWERQRPGLLALKPADEHLFEQLENLSSENVTLPPPSRGSVSLLFSLSSLFRPLATHAQGMLEMVGEIAIWSVRLARNPVEIPFLEISAAAFRSGAQALPITGLLGFLIGIVLSYLSAAQLHELGAGFLIVNLLGTTIVRELGPLLAAILNAGRSGSSITAQIGVMCVTRELEAMAVLGISPTLRLALPRVVGQMIALPLVVLWTDVLALAGGMLGANLQLGISGSTFIHRLPQVVSLTSLSFGIGKGALFGALVAIVACYFGLRIRPDTEGLATGTTQSVVTSLTLVLLVDALLAVLFAHIGQ